MKKLGMVKTIIWDLDGTLLDSFAIYEDVLSQILPKYNRRIPSPEEIVMNYHGGLHDSIGGVLDGDVTAEELQTIVDDFLAAQDSHYEIIEGHLFKDAERLAKRAHGAGTRQIIVTNRDHLKRMHASPRSIVANSDLKHYVDIVICGDDSEHRKPKPEVLGGFKDIYMPEETIVIGDQFVDAEFAYNLGVNAVLVHRDGGVPHHMDKLAHDWKSHVTIVDSLDSVII